MAMIQHKKLILLSILTLVVVTSAAVLYVITKQTKSPTPTDTQTANNVEDKNQPLVTDSSTNQSTDKTTIPAKEQETTSPGQVIEKPTILRAEVVGDNVRVTAVFYQTTNGTCKLTVEKTDSNPYSLTTSIVVGPSYYVCDGFLFPKSKLTPGLWNISVTHLLDQSSAISDNKAITIE